MLRGTQEELVQRELQQFFGGHKFGEAKVQLLIPGYDGLRDRIVLFRAGPDRSRPNLEILADAVALAAVAGLGDYRWTPSRRNLQDGAWALCPVLAGIVEALHGLRQRLDELAVCSIGTSHAAGSATELDGGGFFGWGPNGRPALRGQGEAAYQQAAQLVPPERFLRVDCSTRYGDSLRSGFDEIQKLRNLGRVTAVETFDALRTRFFIGSQVQEST